jgi:malonyl-CoA decarboxylase
MTLLADLLSTVSSAAIALGRGGPGQPPDAEDSDRRVDGCAKGEVSGSTAQQILDRTRPAEDDAKLAFFQHLAGDLAFARVRARGARGL